MHERVNSKGEYITKVCGKSETLVSHKINKGQDLRTYFSAPVAIHCNHVKDNAAVKVLSKVHTFDDFQK